MKKRLDLKVGSLEEAGNRFISAWYAAKSEKDGKSKESRELLTFVNLEVLLQILSPRRIELLKCLHQHGTSSIRMLAKLLKRDYSNVYTDVKQLLLCGLIEKTKDDKFCVPWEELIAHFSLEPPTHFRRPPKKRPIAKVPHHRLHHGVIKKKAAG